MCSCPQVNISYAFAMTAYFIIGEVFFGVLYNLLGVLGLETGVVLGAIFTFFGVAIRLGDGDDFGIAVALDLNDRMENSLIREKKIKTVNELLCDILACRIANGSWNFRSGYHALCGCCWCVATTSSLFEQFSLHLLCIFTQQFPLNL